MTEEEREKHIGHLVVGYFERKEELKKVASEATPYIELWGRLNDEFQNLSTTYNHPIDLSQYPSADEVHALIGKLRRKKRHLRRIRAFALKTYGIELQ